MKKCYLNQPVKKMSMKKGKNNKGTTKKSYKGKMA
tara:strand:+ start:308 stop:412 length:105 start_codon:yes stop_codon:yes gene_type:complete